MKVLVLHSGGMDSTVCLLMAKEAGHEVFSLGIDYGQRHSVEMLYAKAQCEKHKIDRKVVSVSWDKPLRETPLDRNPAQMPKSVSTAFLPGRNLLFLSLAGAEAAGIGANEIWTGINCVDYSGYPDCTREFLDSFKKTWSTAAPGGPSIVAPLLEMGKPAIAKKAFELGLDIHSTWSCYRPQILPAGVAACGRCDACVLHDFAWKDIKDKTVVSQG